MTRARESVRNLAAAVCEQNGADPDELISEWNQRESISDEAWARGIRPDDICEGMYAAIHWGGDRSRGIPATIVSVRRGKKSGRLIEVKARREDVDDEVITFTYRSWGGLLLKGSATGLLTTRLVCGTMFVPPEDKPF